MNAYACLQLLPRSHDPWSLLLSLPILYSLYPSTYISLHNFSLT